MGGGGGALAWRCGFEDGAAALVCEAYCYVRFEHLTRCGGDGGDGCGREAAGVIDGGCRAMHACCPKLELTADWLSRVALGLRRG